MWQTHIEKGVFAGIDSPVATLYALYCWTTVPSRPRWLWTCNTHNLHVTSIEHTTIFEILEAEFAYALPVHRKEHRVYGPGKNQLTPESYLSIHDWTTLGRLLCLLREIYPRGNPLAACDMSHAGLLAFHIAMPPIFPYEPIDSHVPQGKRSMFNQLSKSNNPIIHHCFVVR